MWTLCVFRTNTVCSCRCNHVDLCLKNTVGVCLNGCCVFLCLRNMGLVWFCSAVQMLGGFLVTDHILSMILCLRNSLIVSVTKEQWFCCGGIVILCLRNCVLMWFCGRRTVWFCHWKSVYLCLRGIGFVWFCGWLTGIGCGSVAAEWCGSVFKEQSKVER